MPKYDIFHNLKRYVSFHPDTWESVTEAELEYFLSQNTGLAFSDASSYNSLRKEAHKNETR